VTDTVTYSTLFLTLLMMVGLFFFIRASTKDRIETLTLCRDTPPRDLLQELTTYFEGRAYLAQPYQGDDTTRVFQGWVRPSWFLAIFLSTLAAVGALCFALVLASLFPTYGRGFIGLVLVAPAAGLYYWRRAGREEQVTVQVQPAPGSASKGATTEGQSELTVIGHRDELIALQQTLRQSS
jgi:hypothetical protein